METVRHFRIILGLEYAWGADGKTAYLEQFSPGKLLILNLTDGFLLGKTSMEPISTCQPAWGVIKPSAWP
ncbi:hypothetical protein SBA6_230001 [Candidatus Sulfopaludibacter sp. SbA6]|nr:hypothetical protein SBA6_230001 [Candidatus Sulfopaludibacter sp. SbA6]